MFTLADFDYNLPSNLIAQQPTKPRDHSRLLILNKENKKIIHQHFFDIIDYLQPNDILILNNSKVIPARLKGQKEKTAGAVEIFLSKRKKEKEDKQEVWECLLKGHRLTSGLKIVLSADLQAELLENIGDGLWLVKFNQIGSRFIQIVEEIGKTPLPPYIKKELTPEDRLDYQTIYAADDKKGSVAAPTAGFHFTPELLEKIKDKGVKIVYITLHVGLGTFLPVKVNNIQEHKMHAEWVEVSKQTIAKIKQAQENGGKVIPVGTTSCRSLEAVWQKNKLNQDFADWVDIFIYPPYEFKIVDALITNFHLPKSTLLMLVSALAGKDNIMKAYKSAIAKKYRFYSYGDAMFIF